MTDRDIDKLAVLRSVLNGIESLICVCDCDTFEILFLNDSIRKHFQLKGDGVGQKCYKLLQNLDEPCDVCPYKELIQEPNKTFIWEHHERVKGSILRKTAKLIDWPDGRKAHLEYAVDITELRQIQETVLHLETKAKQVYFDPLTEIYNRRYFDENSERLMSILSRSDGGVLSLAMIDLDYFKNYNDLYGHIKGDECLKNIAQIIQNDITRKDDFVARYGGEEFVIVLPNAKENGARMIIERMIKDIRKKNILHEDSGKENRVTVSIGLVTGKVTHNLTIKDFILRADEMLYTSKRNGRNRYTFAEL
ncbi:MAG: GGDEF domain-containing protein [Treponema sp.]|jgi:diguanylate cyclase (GGDEF)-like protein|nr:GGDEF domain-containing protein [Treponema sp.]